MNRSATIKALLLVIMTAFSFSIQADQNTSPNTGAGQQQTNCSSLTSSQQQFASQLDPINKDMFCSQFSEEQRTRAMQSTGQPDNNGNVLTGNQAVQSVAQQDLLIPTPQAQPGTTQPNTNTNSACPAQ